MVDKLGEETSPPTIILGLGDFGAKCLERMESGEETISEHRSLAAVRATGIPCGISFLSDRGLSRIGIPVKGGARAEICSTLLANPDPLIEWFKSEIERLGRAGVAGEGPGRIKVFMVGGAEEIDASALALALPDLISDHLDGFIANWSISLSGFFLLPKGRSSQGANVFSFLRELSAPISRYDQMFFATEANLIGLVGDEGTQELMAGFVDMMSEPRCDSAVAEIMDVSGARAAGFGLTSLVHPVSRLVAQESSRFATELVKTAILSGATDSYYRMADEYLKTEGFDVNSLRERLIMDDEGAISDGLSVETVALRGVPISLWADRLSSYADFLGQERLPRLLGRMDANIAKLKLETKTRLMTEVDDLMGEAAAIDKAGRFLDRLDEKSAELREAAKVKGKTEVDEMDDLPAFCDRVVDRIKNFPEPAAIAMRAVVLAPLAYFFFRAFATVLGQFPDRYLNPAYVPPAVPAGVTALVITIVFMFLLYQRAESGLGRAKNRYMLAIDKKYRGMLNRAVWTSLDNWLGGAWPALIAEERQALTGFKKDYLRAVAALEPAGSGPTDTGVCRSVLAIFGRDNDLRYKRGQYDVADEAGRFAVLGHDAWRTADPDELKRTLVEFCRRGLTFADQRSIDRLVLELMLEEENEGALLDDLRRRSRPFTAMMADTPVAVEVAAVPGGRESPLVRHTGLFKEANVVAAAGHHRLAFAQLVCPIEVEDLASFPEWRRDHEGEAA